MCPVLEKVILSKFVENEHASSPCFSPFWEPKWRWVLLYAARVGEGKSLHYHLCSIDYDPIDVSVLTHCDLMADRSSLQLDWSLHNVVLTICFSGLNATLFSNNG